jgi:pimeloyl-ACP methyl ester carboxylesterase
VGVSAGGAFGLVFALDFPDRVVSLVVISTTSPLPGGPALPGPTGEFMNFVGAAKVDWWDPESVKDYLVDYSRVLSGDQRPFDEGSYRDLVRREVGRARNIATLQNHDVIPDDGRSRSPLSSISVPTLVIHGTADPMFPVEHGEALAEEIPGARLLVLDGAGHGVYRQDWEIITQAIGDHTAPQPPS